MGMAPVCFARVSSNELIGLPLENLVKQATDKTATFCEQTEMNPPAVKSYFDTFFID